MGRGGGAWLGWFDNAVLDAGVRGTAWAARTLGRFSSLVDRYVVDGVVRAIGFVVKAASYPARALQSGVLTGYALWIGAGFFVVLGWVAWFR